MAKFKNFTHNKYVIIWLLSTAFMVLMMVFIGGITRLTDSGLSITEWQPIRGVMPPLTSSEWFAEFDKYKESPEFKLINYGMSIDDFKRIYLWEYFHRLMGRVTGIVFFIPFIFFLVTKKLTSDVKKYLFIVCILGLIQGFVGWYMVKSGLVDKPDVCHFRLAFHLAMACMIYGLILWKIFDLVDYRIKLDRKICNYIYAINVLIICQIIFGAFVAGLDAGLIYNNFPLMGNSWFPDEIKFNNWYLKIFIEPGLVQFLHRMMAYAILAVITYLIYLVFNKSYNNSKKYVIMLGFIVVLQAILGILTLLYEVPIILASAHQIAALILLSYSLYLCYCCTKIK